METLEKMIIRTYIGEHGAGSSWKDLSKNAGLQRCGRSCCSCWLNYLQPGLKHGNFTEEEDKIIHSPQQHWELLVCDCFYAAWKNSPSYKELLEHQDEKAAKEKKTYQEQPTHHK
ncbi:unnamed protein product [Musa hybrid cultivar]